VDREMVRYILKFTGFMITATLLLFFLSISPALAGSLVISPGSTAMEVLPGTTGRIVISVENGLGRSYSFRFSPAQMQNLPEGYSEFPDLSWLNLITEDTLLAPGEKTWVTVEVAVPDDESLLGQKWAISIDISCPGEPLLNDSSIILVTVDQARPARPDWFIGGGIIAASMIGAVLWTQWKDRQRAEWTTGLKARHWLE
jgi:hypothetical protein